MPHLHTFTHLHPALCTVAQQNPSNLCKLFLKKQQECLQSQFQEADYLLTFAFQMSQVELFHGSISYFSNSFNNSPLATCCNHTLPNQNCARVSKPSTWKLLLTAATFVFSELNPLTLWVNEKSPYIFNAFLGWNLIPKHQGEVD